MNIYHKREYIIQINVLEINKLQNDIDKSRQYLHHNRINVSLLEEHCVVIFKLGIKWALLFWQSVYFFGD